MRTICERITILQIALKCSHSVWTYDNFAQFAMTDFLKLIFHLNSVEQLLSLFHFHVDWPGATSAMFKCLMISILLVFHCFVPPNTAAAHSQSETLKHSIKQLFILLFRLTLARKRMFEKFNTEYEFNSRLSGSLIEIFEPAGTLHAGLNILRTLSILTWLNFQPILAMKTISSSFFQDRGFSSENKFFPLVWSLKWQFSILIKFFFYSSALSLSLSRMIELHRQHQQKRTRFYPTTTLKLLAEIFGFFMSPPRVGCCPPLLSLVLISPTAS